MTLRALSGRQRMAQIRLKVRIKALRQLRDFMAGKSDILAGTSDLERGYVQAEFNRLYWGYDPFKTSDGEP